MRVKAPLEMRQISWTLTEIPEGLQSLASANILSKVCLNVIVSLTRKTIYWTRGQSVATDIEWQTLYQLLAAPDISETEQFLLHGLISFCNQFPDKFEKRNPFFNIALKCFNDGAEAKQKLALKGVGWKPWLIWVAIVLAGVLEITASPLKDRHVVLDGLLDECELARDWSRLQELLRSFLWTDALGGHWKMCWEAGMRRYHLRNQGLGRSDVDMIPLRRDEYVQNPKMALKYVLEDSHELSEAWKQTQV
jgi:hypothetical protein